jgi:transposase
VKSGVTKACWYDPELNRSYVEQAEHFSMAILPARPYHPRDTPAIEAAVHVTENRILAPLRKRQFFSLAV